MKYPLMSWKHTRILSTKLLLQDRDADTKNESSLSSSGNNSESAYKDTIY